MRLLLLFFVFAYLKLAHSELHSLTEDCEDLLALLNRWSLVLYLR